MLTESGPIDVEEVLVHLPTPVVVLELGTGAVVYANVAAEKLPFAYTADPSWRARDEHGVPLAPEAYPHSEACRGQCFDGRLVQFEREGARHTLRFHCHSLGDRFCVLTFDDITPLDRSQRELRDALQSRDEVVSMAAHELRSPLGALQLIAERLCRKAVDLDPAGAGADIKKLADAAVRQTRRLNVLVSNLLDVSRIRTGRFTLDLEHGSLADMIADSCEPLVEQARAAGSALHVELHDRAEGLWDSVRMEQLVVNLVTNAIKYGGPPVIVHLHRFDHHVELIVSDEGPGISPADQAQIFEPFARANPRHRAQSLGLGLFIVREIVNAHGGEIRLESRPGSTSFSIVLPLRDHA